MFLNLHSRLCSNFYFLLTFLFSFKYQPKSGISSMQTLIACLNQIFSFASMFW